MEKKPFKVLIVDDDSSVRDFLGRFLRLQNIENQLAKDGLQAIEFAKKEKFDLVFLDIRMPEINGLRVFSELKKINPDLSCIFITGYAIEATLLKNTVNPTVVCLRKPFENINYIKDIINKVKQGIDSYEGGKDSFKDKRAFVRLDIILEADYRLKHSDGSFIHSESRSIAPGGLKLLVQEELALGAILDMKLRASGSQTECKASGEVVWTKENPDKPSFYDAGIKLLDIDLSELTNLLIECGKISPIKS